MPHALVPILHGANYFPVQQVPLTVVRDRQGEHARHAHDFIEIVLVAKGRSMHLRFPPADDRWQRYELVENDVFLVPRGWSHAYEQRDGFEIYNLLFVPELLAPEPDSSAHLAALCTERVWDDGCGLAYKLHLRRAERVVLEACMHVIAHELARCQRGFEAMVRAKLVEALVLLDRAAAQHSDAAVSADNGGVAFAAALAYIEEHFHEPIQLEDMAQAAHLSPAYFCERFRLVIGCTPGKYLVQRRIDYAQELLRTTRLPITEIALRAGFCDSSHFARVFKRALGRSPRAFQLGVHDV